MTDESSNRDLWLTQIKQSVKTKVGDRWSEDSWTETVEDVAWWLHSSEGRSDTDTIDAAAGLIRYRIAKKSDLEDVAGSPPDVERFRGALKGEGVPPMVCDLLFNRYIPQQQQKQDANLPGNKRKAVPVTFSAPTVNARPDSLLFGREQAKATVVEYLIGCKKKEPRFFESISSRYSLLGASGVKGIGKSELQAQICTKWAQEALGPQTKTLYVTYNGGGKAGDYCKRIANFPRHWVDTVGHLLLVSCGVPVTTATTYSFDQAITFIRRQMSCEDGETLVVCVDEIIELDVRNPQINKNVELTVAQKIMSDCMGKQDAADGTLMFVFTAILDSMFHQLSALSGRRVTPVELSLIPLRDVFSDLLEQKLKALAVNQPAVHQLILSCAGHPRATVDGLPIACSHWGGEENEVTTAAIIKARNAVIQTCKFNVSYLDEGILKAWFGMSPLTPEVRRDLLEKGILHSFNDKVEFLFPLLLQEWALQNQNHSAYGYHLSQLFDADQIVGEYTEKFMEAILYHYEAVLRLALEGTSFTLASFYKSNHIGAEFKDREVSARVPAQAPKLVKLVDEFTDMDLIIEFLETGFLVVSEAHSEKGIEYLAPYQARDGSLVVACVQCKFVKEKTDWAKIRSKMADAVALLDAKEIAHFPVVYTTVDQASIQKGTFKKGVYFTETDIFKFTSRLGLLRLHTQKLGNVLGHIHPVLRGADVLFEETNS